MKKMFLVLLLLPSFMSAAPFQASLQTPALLAQAHQAYLEGDFSRAVMNAKQAYMQNGRNSVAQKNVLQLVDRISSVKTPGRLEVGWTLPPEVSNVRVAVARRLDNGVVRHKIVVGGEYKQINEIETFQLIRYPDTIILDKAKNIGDFDDSKEYGQPEFYYNSKGSPFIVTSGLYLLKFTTKSGSNVDGWFFITDRDNSTASPQFVNFEGSPVFTSSTPQISWLDFISPQYVADTDYRMLSIWVGTPNTGQGHWNFWTPDMTQRTATLGAPVNPDNGWTRGPLVDGNYYVLLNYNESHRFGPIRIARRSETVKYFSVKTKN